MEEHKITQILDDDVSWVICLMVFCKYISNMSLKSTTTTTTTTTKKKKKKKKKNKKRKKKGAMIAWGVTIHS